MVNYLLNFEILLLFWIAIDRTSLQHQCTAVTEAESQPSD